MARNKSRVFGWLDRFWAGERPGRKVYCSAVWRKIRCCMRYGNQFYRSLEFGRGFDASTLLRSKCQYRKEGEPQDVIMTPTAPTGS